MAYIAQLPAFEIEKRRLCIRLSSSHARAHATTQLLIYLKPLNRHLRPFVQGTLQNHTKAFVIFGRLLMLPLLREKGYYMPHMSGFEDETEGDPS